MVLRTWAQRGVAALALAGLAACSSTTHPTALSGMGKNVSDAVMEQQLGQAGPVVLETVVSAHWAVSLSVQSVGEPQGPAGPGPERP